RSCNWLATIRACRELKSDAIGPERLHYLLARFLLKLLAHLPILLAASIVCFCDSIIRCCVSISRWRIHGPSGSTCCGFRDNGSCGTAFRGGTGPTARAADCPNCSVLATRS